MSLVEKATAKVDISRLRQTFDEISPIGKTAEGLNRLAYSPSNKEALNLVVGWMKDAGLKVSNDPVFNVFGRRDGISPADTSVVSGSHIDSTTDGGRFDGTIGVLGAMECMRVISEMDIAHTKPIELAVFAAEESARFQAGTLGSRSMTGEITKDDLLRLKDSDGITLWQAMERFGGHPDRIEECRTKLPQIGAIIELHIEQGPVLERLGKTVAVVTGIVSVDRIIFKVKGEAIHSGGGTMAIRRDALAAAAEIVLFAEKLAWEHENIRLTAGDLKVFPGKLNTVPGEAIVGVDLRVAGNRDRFLNILMKGASRICKGRKVTFETSSPYSVHPQKMSPHLVHTASLWARRLGLNYCEMPSFGGHDSQVIGKTAQAGMIFIPSKNGISHNWKEWSDFKDVAACTRLLLATILSSAKVQDR
ncbi:MAG: Zn-dependent hydrolase [Thaumarchaeota archaeon]|nr:Zn-dependent hydrolase [Nitrososphaerota archaeon]